MSQQNRLNSESRRGPQIFTPLALDDGDQNVPTLDARITVRDEELAASANSGNHPTVRPRYFTDGMADTRRPGFYRKFFRMDPTKRTQAQARVSCSTGRGDKIAHSEGGRVGADINPHSGHIHQRVPFPHRRKERDLDRLGRLGDIHHTQPAGGPAVGDIEPVAGDPF